MKGEQLKAPALRKDLEGLARHSDYAIIGPAGLYLRTLPLVSYELLFSKINKIEVVTKRSDLNGEHVDLNKVGLAGFEDGFVNSASYVRFNGHRVKVASPPYLALDYLLRNRSISDLCAFVKARGDIEPETLRSLLKATHHRELFEEKVLPLLYDFAPSTSKH